MPHLMLAAPDPFGVVMTIVGLGGLIFFHELGHFLACRLTGTRVEAFSVGFGPELFGWTRGPTRYKISAIPLGGYVKMAAENPGDARTDAPDEFPNKSFGQRLFIMANGVLFNLILAFVFFAWAFGIGLPFEAARVGGLREGSPAWEAGLRVGDEITHLGGEEVLGFEDLTTGVAFSDAGEVLDLTVRRDGETLTVPVRPRYSELAGMPAIGVQPSLGDAAVGVAEGSPAATAGGRAGDRVLRIDGRPIDTPFEGSALLLRAAGRAAPDATEITVSALVRRADGSEETLRFTVPINDDPQVGIAPYAGRRIASLRGGSPAGDLFRVGDVLLAVDGRTVEDLGVFRDVAAPDRLVASVTVERGGEILELTPPAGSSERALAESIAGEMDFDSTRVAPFEGRPAARAGLRPGDRVVAVGDRPVSSWSDITAAIRARDREPLPVAVDRGGEEPVTITVEPAGSVDMLLFGYQFAPPQRIVRETNLLRAVGMGWDRSIHWAESVVLTLRGLLTRRVAADKIGGPILLAEATYKVQESGWARFLYLLAIISINLAILNLLPIPVLDGGQIVLLVAEKVRGEPLPERVIGYMQFVGLVMILGLMALAFYNDIARLLGGS